MTSAVTFAVYAQATVDLNPARWHGAVCKVLNSDDSELRSGERTITLNLQVQSRSHRQASVEFNWLVDERAGGQTMTLYPQGRSYQQFQQHRPRGLVAPRQRGLQVDFAVLEIQRFGLSPHLPAGEYHLDCPDIAVPDWADAKPYVPGFSFAKDAYNLCARLATPELLEVDAEYQPEHLRLSPYLDRVGNAPPAIYELEMPSVRQAAERVLISYLRGLKSPAADSPTLEDCRQMIVTQVPSVVGEVDSWGPTP